MDSEHLEFTTSLRVVRTWSQNCTAAYHSHENYKMFMSSIGLQDDTDDTVQPDGFSEWKFRVVDPHAWLLACVRYGF